MTIVMPPGPVSCIGALNTFIVLYCIVLYCIVSPKRCKIGNGCYWSLIANRIRAFDWYQNQRPWITMNWPWTAIMRSVALHTCVSGPTTKIWMKIDPYYQRQKYSPWIAVSSKIIKGLCGYSQGFAGQGASNESGVVGNGDFRLFYPPHFPNLHI